MSTHEQFVEVLLSTRLGSHRRFADGATTPFVRTTGCAGVFHCVPAIFRWCVVRWNLCQLWRWNFLWNILSLNGSNCILPSLQTLQTDMQVPFLYAMMKTLATLYLYLYTALCMQYLKYSRHILCCMVQIFMKSSSLKYLQTLIPTDLSMN